MDNQRPMKRIRTQPSTDSLAEDAIDSASVVSEIDVLDTFRPVDADPHLLQNTTARAQAMFATSITAENEVTIRTLHRSLENCSKVGVMECYDGRVIWLVFATDDSIKLWDTHAGGREIHILPDHELPPHTIMLFRPDPLRRINPRRFLGSVDLRTIREYFPGSVGVRLLICGFLMILFEDRSTMKACWELGTVDSIGCLRVGYMIARYDMTSDLVESGYAVAKEPDEYLSNHGCLGLLLRMANGEKVITTTTHAFVKCVTSSSALRLRIAEWYVYVKDAFARFISVKSSANTSAIGEIRRNGGIRPLGTTIWPSGTDRKVGTITKTYDPHPMATYVPFPSGFKHDLSLITDDDLPILTNPAKTPSITCWGSYAEALDGSPLFVLCLNVMTGRWRTAEGHGISRAAHAAIAAGSEYSWTRRAVSQNTALLWRTTYDPSCLKGYSGSVLCLGQLSDATARAIVFQNFQSPIRAEHVFNDQRSELTGNHHQVFKAGFLLPEEIRQSTIEIANPPSAPDFESHQTYVNS